MNRTDNMKRSEITLKIYLAKPPKWMKPNELESEIEASNELNVGNAASGDKRKVVVGPNRKAKQDPINKHEVN